MRSDWVPLSASALVIGAMALVMGTLLNPAHAGSSGAETLRVVNEASGRWLAMSVMYVIASFALTLGLPTVLTMFERRGRTVGLVAVAVFAVGAIGTSGYAMLLVFFRALVTANALRGAALDRVTDDPGLKIFLDTWVACFYGGILLLAVALLMARVAPRWIPVLLVLFVVAMPFASHLGRVATALQVLALAVAFTGIATTAVSRAQQPGAVRASVF